VFTTVTAIGMILLSFLAALTGSRNFTRRTYELVEAAGRLSRGDFNVCIDTRTGDERDQLIQAFNDMGPKLEDQLRVHESLRLATEVQQNLLPGKEPAVPGLDIAGISLYCDETGGDYYDFLTTATTPKAGTTVVIGDVSGHGAYSALLMASARAALRLRASLPGSAAEIVADVNRQFAEDVGDTGAFMTLFYLTVDGVRREARWVRAGHDPAIYYEPKSGRFEELGGHGAPLGVDEEVVFEEMEKDNLKPGGIIFIGTDGIWETTGREGRLFGKKALLRLIETHAHRSAHEIMQAVIRELEAFRKGIKPSDDITMVVIKLME
jgi:sigma-B regulation protein RsbU (phosphoserine phosphatase)